MSLPSGSRLGAYEIQAPLGAGGMGEVYRARDTKLGREVAIKMLPDVFAHDAERVARFTREAQTLASLNHPNIATLHAIGEETLPNPESRIPPAPSERPVGRVEGNPVVHFLVMELVEGDDLSVLIARGAMPLAEALPIATQIAEALDAAHEQGVIHRDLKPANIKVRPDGAVKVLDFGLAKALDPAGASGSGDLMHSPTMTARATQMGMIIGTAAYMAPEQAKGKAVDRRADIWAFGVVLYEMLTGRRAFPGDDVSETLASVLAREADLAALPADLPAPIRRLLRRCLEKDPKRRLSAISDARLELEETGSSSDQQVAPTAATAPVAAAPARKPARLPWTVAVLAMVSLVAAVVTWAPWRAPVPAAVLRVNADIGLESSLDVGIGPGAVISPDGRAMVFVALGNTGQQLFVRKLDQLQATALSGTANAQSPFFSPDSQWIGFFADTHLKKISITGGAAVSLCQATALRGATWTDDDTIIFQPVSGPGPLMIVPASGGTPTPLVTLAGSETTQRWPQVLPGGTGVIYTGHTTNSSFESANIMLQPLPAGTPKVLVRGGFHGRYLRSGHVVYMHEGTLFAVPFDLAKLDVVGRPVPALEGALSNSGNAGAQYSVSETGTLVYSPGRGAGASRSIFWLDPSGATTPLRAAEADWIAPQFSPDGRTLALTINDGKQSDVWRYDWAHDTSTKLTFDPGNDAIPVWSPDGKRIVFGSDRATRGVTNLYWQRADGTGEVQRLTDSPNTQVAFSFDPTGRYLAFYESTATASGDLMILPLEGAESSGWKPGKPTVLLSTPANEAAPMFSPDGRWMAYMSDETGQMQVYVRPFPGPGGKWQISTTGVGIYPIWSRARRELLYQDVPTSKIMVLPYTVEGESFHAAKPAVWSPGRFMLQGVFKVWDLHPDGLRAAIAKPPDSGGEKRNKVILVLNFFDELKRIAPVGK